MDSQEPVTTGGSEDSYRKYSESITNSLNGVELDDYRGQVTSQIYGDIDITIIENEILNSGSSPISTFSVDVDTASYSMFRKYLSRGEMPGTNGIRTEEMVNYFDYSYSQPLMDKPFGIQTVLSGCPWNTENKLVMIGIQARDIEYIDAPANNLVFLIDVSGSMRSESKLDMVKASLALLVENLREEDSVSIVTYAGTAETVLMPTSGSNKDEILTVLNSLEAGGGTNGSGGIELAYDLAYDTFIFDGNNRVLLATDGDFNIGNTSNQALIDTVTTKAEIGIYLTILAYGQNHYAVHMMEELSNNGQGTYHFIDTLNEADKVLNHEIASTIVPIADDVKVQIEWNTDIIASYRLIGYENRVLSIDDFDDDEVDAGDMGAGHNVTAFYEVTYNDNIPSTSEMLATIGIRYKDVGEDDSKLVEGIIRTSDYTNNPNSDFLFATAVVEVSLLMRNSEYKGNSSFDGALERIRNNIGLDPYGLRQEFYDLSYTLKDIMNIVGPNE